MEYLMKKLTTLEFVEKSLIIHGTKYDYSNAIYVNAKTKIIIICSVHGQFLQTPSNHLSGNGCEKCSRELVGSILKSNTEDFIKKSIFIHNNKYDYSEVIYTNNKNKISILCPRHGRFMQSPSDHLSGRGCIKCGGKLIFNIQDFITEANKIHNFLYDYSGVNYINALEKIEIICKTHGKFFVSPNCHVNMKSGCPACSHIVSRKEKNWISSLNINNLFFQHTISILSKEYKVDAYDPLTNTIYEFYGDYWHGNPKIFNPNDVNKNNNKTFGELYNQTIIRELQLKNMGYKIISMWECNWSG
jgi:hypothetical protein